MELKFLISIVQVKKDPKISIIFLSGYKSDMLGTKASFLDTLSKNRIWIFKIWLFWPWFIWGKIEKQLVSDWVNEAYFTNKKEN